ncbi:MAG: DUF1932 domain-containing protein [Anaerolineae bacterium]
MSEGRRRDFARAEKYGLIDARTLKQLCATCSVIVSVCPPDAAEAVAESVVGFGFAGLYIDANAISPQRARNIGQALSQGGATLVDGGIIGGPAWKPNSTWLYLSGAAAAEAAALFAAGPLETRVIGDEIGKASALKMCFAAYSKGTTALLSAVMGAAEGLGVRAELEQQWSQNGSAFAEEAANRVRTVTAKAWRFAGEMNEIAATFESAGMPDGFHNAAAEVYRRMADFKDAAEVPALEEVLAALAKATR